jgi:pimeloyl-ACP methyl ester carboxylesterase
MVAVACSDDEDQPGPADISPVATMTATATPGGEETPRATVTTPTASATSTPTPELPPAVPIDWAACENGFECAEYDVPLDYDNPEGKSITLALRRLPAGDRDHRIGLLFVNPGGPGGSTIDILSGWARSLPADIRNRFDVILMDPRGVGHSSPLLCHDNVQELIGLDPYPETDEDWQTIVDATREFTEACADAGGDMLQHLGTREAARDMDRIREAEGEETITYFGYSYGTTLGQVYADLFPTRVRAMVLDGAVDNSLPADDVNLEQILGFEAAFQRYLDDCAERQCFNGDPAETVRRLIAQADAAPIPAPGSDRPAGPGEIVQAILGSLYSETTWSFLTSGIDSALNGNADTLIFLADSFTGREPNGEYSNLVEAHKAVNCLDTATDRDPEYHIGLAEDFEAQAPWFGPAAASYGFYCAFWEAEPEPLTAPRAAGAPPILVIGSTGDPATPYKWAVSLAAQLESGVLLTRDGEGHLAYRYGNRCIDEAIEAYLIELVLPPDGLVCGDAGIEPAPPVP